MADIAELPPLRINTFVPCINLSVETSFTPTLKVVTSPSVDASTTIESSVATTSYVVTFLYAGLPSTIVNTCPSVPLVSVVTSLLP